MSDRDDAGRFLPAHTQAGPGRQSGYDETWMPEQAFRLALLGLIDREIAAAFGVHEATLYRWMEDHPLLREAVLRGGERADANVAHALYNRAVGVTVVSEKAFKGKDGEIVVAQTKTQLPADVKAGEVWLRNRQRTRWRREELPVGEAEEAPGSAEAEAEARKLDDEQLEERIAQLERRRQHDKQK